MTSCAPYESPAAPPRWTLGPEAGIVTGRAGFALFDWQQRVLDKAMEVDAADRLTRSQVTLICPRRNGKTQLVMARILAGCLLWEEQSILYTAHLGDTARHTFTAFLDLLNHSLWLQQQVDRVGYGKGDESVRFRNGSTFSIRARTASGGRGLECSTLILDEALELKDDHISALTPLLAKANAQGGGQLWLVSSAGHGRSDVLARARDRGRAATDDTDPDLAFFEWAATRDADPADPAVWAATNPSLGTPILGADFLRMQQRSMNPEEFGREHLGWWTSEVATPFLPHGAWAACSRLDPPPLPDGARVTLGIELQDYGRAAALAASVDLGEQTAWVEVLERWADPDGLDPAVLAQRIAAHADRVGSRLVIGDDYTTAAILDHVEALRLPVERLNISAVREASQTLLTATTSGRLLHPIDPRTDVEMANAGSAPTGDGLQRLSRKTSTGPSTAAFAIAAAAHHTFRPAPAVPLLLTG